MQDMGFFGGEGTAKIYKGDNIFVTVEIPGMCCDLRIFNDSGSIEIDIINIDSEAVKLVSTNEGLLSFPILVEFTRGLLEGKRFLVEDGGLFVDHSIISVEKENSILVSGDGTTTEYKIGKYTLEVKYSRYVGKYDVVLKQDNEVIGEVWV